MATDHDTHPQDATPDQTEAEAPLDSERHFRELAGNIHHALWIVDPTFSRTLYVNPAYEAIWGRSAATLFDDPRSSIEAIHPDDRGPILEYMERLAHEPATIEFRIIRPDGAIHWLRTRASPVRDEAGEVYRIVGVTEDITDRREAERERALLFEYEREARWQVSAVLESIADAFVVIDREWRFTYLNSQAERRLGRFREKILGETLWDVIPESAATISFTELHRAMAEQAPVEFEQYYEPDDLWIEVRAFPAATGLSIYYRDITARKRTELAQRLLAGSGAILAASFDYHDTLTSIARLMVPALADFCLVDLITRDGAHQRLAAAHRDPALEAKLWQIRQYSPPPRSRLVGLIQSGEPLLIDRVTEREIELIAENEAHRQVIEATGVRSIMAVPLVARGRVLGLIIYARAGSGRCYGPEDLALAQELADRTALAVDNARLYQEAEEARKEAERRAREEEALRRAAQALNATFKEAEVIQQIARSALSATEADGAIVERFDKEQNELEVIATAGRWPLRIGSRVPYAGSYSESAVKRAESALVADLSTMNSPLPDDLDRLCGRSAGLFLPFLEAGEPIGSLILIRVGVEPPFHPDEIQRARTFADLATLALQRTRLLEDSEQKRAELERALASRSRLMRGFSHDVKNPLGAVDMILQFLEMGLVDRLSERQVESVGRARLSLDNALRLIEDLLDLARADTGEMPTSIGPVDLCDTIRGVAEEYRLQAEARGLTLEVAIPEPLPVVASDTVRLHQILGNLVSNAIKYTPDGGHIHMSTDARATDGWLAIEVSDTGPGISAEEQPLIFQEFERLGNAASEKGVGIGLAISQRIAHALGGDLTVQSQEGAGSTFTLWLPSTPPPAPQPRHPIESPAP